jgi:hypothetical protein
VVKVQMVEEMGVGVILSQFLVQILQMVLQVQDLEVAPLVLLVVAVVAVEEELVVMAVVVVEVVVLLVMAVVVDQV